MNNIDNSWQVSSLQSENKLLRARIEDLEKRLSDSIESSGNYFIYQGETYKSILETKNPDLVITSKDLIIKLIEGVKP